MTTTKRGRGGRPPAELAPATLDAILDAALRMFAVHGYEGTSVAALNRDLGVSHNLLHQRFGSKEKLWFSAVDHAFEAVNAEMLPELLNAEGGPVPQLRRLLTRFMEVNARRPEILRLVTIEGSIESPRFEYMYSRHIEPLLQAVVTPLRDATGAEVLSPSSIRSLYFLVAHGATAPFAALALSRRIGPGDPLDPEAVAEHAAFVADLIVAGLRLEDQRSAQP